MDRPFLVGADGAVRATWGALLDAIAGRPHRPVFQPEDTWDAVAGLLTAAVRGLPLRLLDPDFSDGELARLGVDRADLTNEIAAPATRWSQADACAAARATDGFRLELYTSGTTGVPRRVEHRMASLTRTLRVDARHRDDVWALAYNPTHIAGIQVLLQAFFNGNTLVDVYGRGRDEVLSALRRQGVTHVSATPTFYRLLLPVADPPPSVRSLTLGGERSDASLVGRLRAAFPGATVRNLYASTEAGTLLSSDGDAFGVHPSVQGRVRVHEGRLQVAPELLGRFDAEIADGWFDTGDRVEVVQQDPLRFRILGRERDLINVGGAKVDPAEVEDVLRAHPAVSEARVYARSNSVTGSLLCAELRARAPIDEPALRAWLAERLQPHKVPRLLRVVDALSQTRTGKLNRHG